MAIDSSSDVAVLDPQTCWDLVGGAEIGRLAVSVGRHPDIFPVNHVVDGHTLVFRTAEGTKFSALFVDHDVAFEVDGVDPAAGEAWSVVIKGRALEIPVYDMPDDAAAWRFPWGTSRRSRYVRITPDEISGRRFRTAQHNQNGSTANTEPTARRSS